MSVRNVVIFLFGQSSSVLMTHDDNDSA